MAATPGKTEPDKDFYLEIEGWCPICEADAVFIAKGPWLRGTLHCQSCENGSAPRERGFAHVLNRIRPNWRDLKVHECSPMKRGISMKMQRECRDYVGTHYYPDKPFGTQVGDWRNENIEAQTFADESFDIVMSLDVAEHVFNPGNMYREIYRTLKPGGIYLSTFPIRKWQVEPAVQLARLGADGSIQFLKEPPEYHGNPISGDGALVTWDYGYDIHTVIHYWVPFRIEISRFLDRRQGILGEYTEVILCTK